MDKMMILFQKKITIMIPCLLKDIAAIVSKYEVEKQSTKGYVLITIALEHKGL